MSMIVYLGYEGKAWIYSDTRVSTEKNGLSYHIHDNCEKARVFGDKIVFGMGYLPAVEQIFEEIEFSNQQLSDIKKITKDAYDKYKGEIGVYVLTVDNNGRYVMYTISNLLNFETLPDIIRNNDLGAAGANSDDAIDYIYQQFKLSVRPHQAILGAYNHVVDEKVGGKCILYQLDATDKYHIKINKFEYRIQDKKKLRKLRTHADMSGQAKFKKVKVTDGNNTALLDSTTRKFYMNNWDIVGVGALDAQFIQAGTLTAEDGFINNLTVNALKTLDKSDSIGDSVDYVYARDNYFKLVTGTITDRQHAKDGNGNLLYWVDAAKSQLTTETTSYPFYNLTYEPVEKFKLYLEGQGVDSYPVMQLGRGDGKTSESAKAFIKKEPDNLNITYHRSNTGAIREVKLDDMGITIKAHDNGTVTIEGKDINVVGTNKVTVSAPNGYDFT
ncbi:hypothetical protein [Paenibacillus aceti]|uniref:Prophage tail endopeptidase domain-containing protein n=1 Tax=Paenibacillus aceti TaxID=1820010 RepID=A0ABQ1W5N1_9BACL|nr:hypothetical protein [Paenibacillus aceti]GGG16190.1 hypothetical protein GCM10010913_42770 [Paenibacillus aceti]